MSNNWKIIGIIATTIIVVMIPLSLLVQKASTYSFKKEAFFVGGEKCITCHQREYNLWKGSDHDNAMNPVNDSTVLGDFNNIEVQFRGKKSRFFKRDSSFYVYTEGIGGDMAEFKIAYTFGVRPLQQYLVPFSKGKYQCLPIAWDTENKKWFDMAGMVYTAEELKPDSWLYWTNQAQNWNGVCAECHSTRLVKNYVIEKDSFKTTWSDIDVNCEACHGPGSEHLEWAKLPEGARQYDEGMGLVIQTSGTTSKQYIEACAPCHSRRTSLGDNDHTSIEYYNNYRPVPISPPLYYADGQILDEDYVFGSFTQSKMYMNDVKCNDCHDSHSLKLKFDGNALCTQCHRAEEYDTYGHHFHKYPGEKGEPVIDKFGHKIPVGDGTLCKTCHMPGKYYMGIDYRRDHSLRIPRPDLSIRYGVPNACNDCHSDKNYQWAEKYITKFYGEHKKTGAADILAAAYNQKAGEDTFLIKIVNNSLYPEIVRATALQYLSSYESNETDSVIIEMLNDPEPIIREAAVNAVRINDQEKLVKVLAPLLNDPVKIVRLASGNRLSLIKKDFFTKRQVNNFNSVMAEYLNSLNYLADFPTGKFNLGNYYSNTGDLQKAEKFYNEAIKSDSLQYPAKVNLAMLYYNGGKIKKAENLFLNLAKNNPEFENSYYYLGLLKAEQKDYKAAAGYLEKAALTPDPSPRVYYNLGLIYQFLNNPGKSEEILLTGYSRDPDNFDIMYALSDLYLKKGNIKKALLYANELREKYPDNPLGKNLTDFIKKKKID